MSHTRRISVEGEEHKILVMGRYDEGMTSVIFQLYISGVQQDRVKVNVLQKHFHEYFNKVEWMLKGKLDNAVEVRVKLRTTFFRKPLYMIYVGEQLVHKEKGRWMSI